MSRQYLWNLVETTLGSLSPQEEPHAAHGGDDEEENEDDGQHDRLEPALLATSPVLLVATAAAEAESAEQGGEGHEGAEDDADQQGDVLQDDLLDVLHEDLFRVAVVGDAVQVGKVVFEKVVREKVGLDDRVKEDVGDVVDDLHAPLVLIVTDSVIAFQWRMRVFTHGFRSLLIH